MNDSLSCTAALPAALPGSRSVVKLLNEVRACTLCAGQLPLVPRPILQLDPRATILIAGQAPGRKAHDSGIPFSDASGDRLRTWMGIDKAMFYDAARVAILPMGLCFPGTGESGDRPPRPECAPVWRDRLLALLPRLQLTLVIGSYAQAWHLKLGKAVAVTDAVAAWQTHWPQRLPMPHPSPRNQRWLRQNPWFEQAVLPALRLRVQALTQAGAVMLDPAARPTTSGHPAPNIDPSATKPIP